jgi:hypothetical protein
LIEAIKELNKKLNDINGEMKWHFLQVVKFH